MSLCIYICICLYIDTHILKHCLIMELCSEKRIVKQFHCCVNMTVYTSLDGTGQPLDLASVQ
jgi:hypothetical protein